MRKVIGAAVAVLMLTLWAPGLSAAPDHWNRVAGWDIRVDSTLNNGCYMLAMYEGRTIVRFGFNMNVGNAYLMVADPDWKSLEVGQYYPLQFQLNRRRKWVGQAKAIDMNGVVALATNLSKGRFFNEFARGRSLRISYQGRRIAQLSLRGSSRAMKEMFRCQRQMTQESDAFATREADPFASSAVTANKVSDPFAQ